MCVAKVKCILNKKKHNAMPRKQQCIISGVVLILLLSSFFCWCYYRFVTYNLLIHL